MGRIVLSPAQQINVCTPEPPQIEEDQTTATISHVWPNAVEADPYIATDITFVTVMELGRRGAGQTIIPLPSAPG